MDSFLRRCSCSSRDETLQRTSSPSREPESCAMARIPPAILRSDGRPTRPLRYMARSYGKQLER